MYLIMCTSDFVSCDLMHVNSLFLGAMDAAEVQAHDRIIDVINKTVKSITSNLYHISKLRINIRNDRNGMV